VTLLAHGFCEQLRLQPARGLSLSLKVAPQERVSKAVVEVASDGSLCFALGANQASYLRAFLLRAYRDQAAERTICTSRALATAPSST
jgi:hypothetical protein